ncbi:MAG: nodulation protein NfeD [Rhodoferax sp.]|nr:nodulation protein NfeD [Rhodoferax sp.]
MGRAWIRVLLALALVYTTALLWAQDQPQPANSERQKIVYVASIDGTIDLGLAPYVQRILDEAVAAKADAVVLKINTLGGRVDAAVQIRDALLASPIRSIAFVDKRAISAGALISLAANTIYMSEGSTIGAATPVQMGQAGEGVKAAGEKTVSYVRKEFRATAESRNRPLLLAEAMVDADVVIPGVVEKGKLLTLTTQEALKDKFIDARADSMEAVLQQAGLAGAELRGSALNWAEKTVRILTEPAVSSLLVTLATLGILIELRAPGFGLPGAVGVASLGLFLWGHWIVQLVGWEEMLLVGAGLVLLALEIFVIPGFGVAGVLGLLGIVAGLVLSVIGPGASGPFVAEAAMRIAASLVIAIALGAVLLRFMTRLPIGRRMIHEDELSANRGFTSTPDADQRWLGRTGVTMTPLRPAGLITIDGQRIDVVSEGELIESGQPIRVVRVDGNRIVVVRSQNTENSEVNSS